MQLEVKPRGSQAVPWHRLAPEEPSASQLLAKLKYRLLGGEGGEGAFFIFRLTSRLWEAEGAGLVYSIIDQRGKEQGVLSPL